MPPGGAITSMAEDEAQRTRTVFGGADVAVWIRMGCSSLVNRCGPRQLVPNWRSWPCFVLEPAGENMTPALLTRTSRRDSREQNASTDALIDARSLRSSIRNSRRPDDAGCLIFA